MSQHDYIIDNAPFPALRDDINKAFQALAGLNSGTNAPITPYPYELWADTSTLILKIRNSANTDWIELLDLNVTNGGLATIASPALTGIPTTPTASLDNNTNQIASTSFVQNSCYPAFSVFLSGTQANISGTQIINFDTKEFDASNAYNLITKAFVIPPLLGGTYQFNSYLTVFPTNTPPVSMAILLYVNGSLLRRMGEFNSKGTLFNGSCSSTVLVKLSPGDSIQLRITDFGEPATDVSILGGFDVSYFQGYRIGA